MDLDFAGVVVLQNSSSTGLETLVTGTAYLVDDMVGSSRVAFVGIVENVSITGLTNGDDYTFTVFSFDQFLNYATGTQITATPSISTAATTFVDNSLSNHCTSYQPLNRSCTGGNETAYNTFAAAAANSAAAGTVLIRGGVYADVLQITRSGGLGAPIIFQNYNGEVVIIDGVNSLDNGEDYGPIWLDHVSYVIVDGIQTRNSVGFGRIVGGGNNVIENNTLLNTTLGLTSFSKRGGLYVTHSHHTRL